MQRLRSQRGFALITALAFMALAVPIVTAALHLSTTLSFDSNVKTGILNDQYSALGGYQHALYRLRYTSEFANLPLDTPTPYSLQLNDQPVDVTVTRTSTSSGPPSIVEAVKNVTVTAEVTPNDALPGVLTIYTYVITINNANDDPFPLWRLTFILPPGFSYSAGSTTGFTANNPSITGQTLVWDVQSQGLSIPAHGSLGLNFDASATVSDGVYCSEAWINPGYRLTTTGVAAEVPGGTPASPWCAGAVVQVTVSVTPTVVPTSTPTTYSFTVSIQNMGVQALNISQIRDLLPQGFLYVADSTSGNLTTNNPSTAMIFGLQRLTWSFNPKPQLASGQTGALNFQANAAVTRGTYASLVWVTMDQFGSAYFTWPIAMVRVMEVFHITSVSRNSRVEAEAWLDDETNATPIWHLRP